MCPHEILAVKGYALEDCFGEEWTRKYLECVADARIKKRVIPIKDVIRLIIKSAVETGTPFTFNRDAVNRANPNKHLGRDLLAATCAPRSRRTWRPSSRSSSASKTLTASRW